MLWTVASLQGSLRVGVQEAPQSMWLEVLLGRGTKLLFPPLPGATREPRG